MAGEATGEVETEDGVLVKRIHVKLHLKAQESHRETSERVHRVYAARCPVYKTLAPAIDITTELVFAAE